MSARRPLALAFALGLLLATVPAHARRAVVQDTPPDEIQEDWQIVIDEPDIEGAGPQISTAMSPVGDGTQPVFIFNLNYRDYPSFAAGGLQVESWQGNTLLSQTSSGSAQCATSGETIAWTQGMKIVDGQITFSVNSGRSTTWGRFGQGQQTDLPNITFDTGLTSLSAYTPDSTVTASGVGWERNRVRSMTLLRVRYYAAGKLLSTDDTPRSIDLSQ